MYWKDFKKKVEELGIRDYNQVRIRIDKTVTVICDGCNSVWEEPIDCLVIDNIKDVVITGSDALIVMI